MGFFDGIHRGHVAVIEDAVKYANSNDIQTIVVTFTHALWKTNGVVKREITTMNLKEKILAELKVDAVIYLDFEKVKDIEPFEFLELITTNFQVKHFSTGFNYCFGKSAKGNIKDLKKYALINNLTVTTIEPIYFEGDLLSSSRIRNEIEQGSVKKAANMLSRPFTVFAQVVHGRALGRTLGIPTINQIMPLTQILPKFGVYASKVKFDNRTLFGVSNIGVKPTVSNNEAPLCETHILNFDEDVYNKVVSVEIIDFIRPEMKFNSLDELKQQMKKDSMKAQEILLTSNLYKHI